MAYQIRFVNKNEEKICSTTTSQYNIIEHSYYDHVSMEDHLIKCVVWDNMEISLSDLKLIEIMDLDTREIVFQHGEKMENEKRFLYVYFLKSSKPDIVIPVESYQYLVFGLQVIDRSGNEHFFPYSNMLYYKIEGGKDK